MPPLPLHSLTRNESSVSSRAAEQEIIRQAALEAGIAPATALAIAERESGFDPNARASKSIYGMFQMSGPLRRQYGVGDSNDPTVQARGWTQFFKDNKGEMARVLGRDPTDAEGYAGHYWGSTRAARMLKMDPNTTVDQVFTPYERSLNPEFDRAGTVGNLVSRVTGDISKRSARYGADAPDLAEFGTPMLKNSTSQEGEKINMPDLSSFGTLAEEGPDLPQPSAQQPQGAPDLSALGTPA
jgi:hypothetical protein